MSKTRLLAVLRKYKPGENIDPIENFITEAFAWLLGNFPRFSQFFLRKITDRLGLAPLPEDCRLDWTTQVDFAGKTPDMLCTAGERCFIFEHKAWTHLHGQQIQNYRDHAEQTFGRAGYQLILITARPEQHGQNPDLSLCWHEVHAWLTEWSAGPDCTEPFFALDFCHLLEEEGMGPPAPIAHHSILSYYSARGLKGHISQLIQRVARSDWDRLVPGREPYQLEVPRRRGYEVGEGWGRIGFTLFNQTHWCPGIFVGFMLDGEYDHYVPPLTQSSPDFTVIISFRDIFHREYPRHPLYRQMIAELAAGVTEDGFDFLNHLDSDQRVVNAWHPVHIRKPMLELFRGTRTAEEQDARFMEAATTVLRRIAKCEAFWQLRAEFKAALPATAVQTEPAAATEAGAVDE